MDKQNENSETKNQEPKKVSAEATSIENFEPNVIAVFSYLVPPITGIIFFLLEKKSKFVRFHAFQSILFGAVVYTLLTLIANLKLLFIGYILQPIATLGTFGIWMLLLWKAYQYEEYQLPFIGKISQDQVNKPVN
jgi:uncharacterized membrane protein